MQCPACGNPVEAHWNVCAACGNALARPGFCPGCGRATEPAWNACPDCGRRLGATPPPGETPARTISGGGTQVLSAAAAPVGPGGIFHGRYRILEVLGQGGMGTVYLAEDQVTGDQVCLKVIRPEFTASASLAQRFLREGKLTRGLRHENVVAVYDVNVASGMFYIVMEYLKGEPLREWLRRALSARRPASLSVATAIVTKILAGLEHAHRAGLVHRDMKPENVMLTGDPERGDFDLKVLDFGLVRDIGSGSLLTAVGAAMGTPVYMAPEQETGADLAGPEADLYAVGVIFYELLIGIPPRGRWELPSRIRNDLPPSVDPFCEKALKSHPAQRYGSVAEFREALLAITSPRSVQEEKARR